MQNVNTQLNSSAHYINKQICGKSNKSLHYARDSHATERQTIFDSDSTVLLYNMADELYQIPLFAFC